MKLVHVHIGRNQYRCFIGSQLVGRIEKVADEYFPVAVNRGREKVLRPMPGLLGAVAAVKMRLSGQIK